MKIIRWLLVCLAISFVSAEEREVLNLWYHVGSLEEQQFFEAQVKRFNDQSKTATIKTLVLPRSAFTNFVLEEAESGNLPDLLYFQSGSLSRFVWSDLLMPLDALMPQAVMNNATESMRQQGTYPVDGRIYALSPTSDALTLYGHRSLLNDAGVAVPAPDRPWDKAKFFDSLRRVSDSGVRWPLDMQLYHADDDWYITAFSPFFQATGGDIFSRHKWDAHIALESLFIEDVKALLSPLTENAWIVPTHKATQRFQRGRAALSLGTTSDWPEFSEALGRDLVILPFPVLGPHHVTSSMGWSFGVTRQSSAPAAASEFISFVMSDVEVLKAADATMRVPATESALQQSAMFSAGGILSVPADQYRNLNRPKPMHPAYPTIRAELADALDDIVAGAEFNQALAGAADTIDADIARNQFFPPFDEL